MSLVERIEIDKKIDERKNRKKIIIKISPYVTWLKFLLLVWNSSYREWFPHLIPLSEQKVWGPRCFLVLCRDIILPLPVLPQQNCPLKLLSPHWYPWDLTVILPARHSSMLEMMSMWQPTSFSKHSRDRTRNTTCFLTKWEGASCGMCTALKKLTPTVLTTAGKQSWAPWPIYNNPFSLWQHVLFCPGKPENLFIGLYLFWIWHDSMKNALVEGVCKHSRSLFY